MRAKVVRVSKSFAADRARAVAFMKGYVKVSRKHHDAAFVQKEGRLAPEPNDERGCLSRVACVAHAIE